MSDLQGVCVKEVAAGWNHSLVLTDKAHVYVCGLGQYGQLGLGQTESKTGFTLLDNFGPKNAQRIFAGGSHSWILIDDIIPIVDHYQRPSPLKKKQDGS